MRLSFDPYVLDVGRCELWCGPEPVAVEPQVFDLLLYLVQNPGRVVTREELLRAVWDGRCVSDSAIDNRINAARRAIGDSGEAQRLIRTVPRKGFRFIGVVQEHVAECAKPILPRHEPRPRAIRSVVIAGTASALLMAAIATLMLWSGTVSSRSSIDAIMSSRAPAPNGLPRVTLALLPFTALGDTADRLNLAAGISENLTAELSRYTDLLMTSRQTVSAHLQKAADAEQIGRELGVRYIIDGSVEQIGGQVRFTVRLADSATGTYSWADRYDRPAGDLLDTEDEIVGRTVNGVRRALIFSEANRPQRGETDAAQLIRRARALSVVANSRKVDADAARLFERATELAPGDRPAKFGLAITLAVTARGLFNVNDSETLRRASEVSDAALAAWPNDAASHYVKGFALRLLGHCEQAIGEFERAIAINRYYAAAYGRLGQCKLMLGAVRDVMALEQRAIRFAPAGDGLGVYYRRIGMAEMLQSHFDQAIFWLEKSRAEETARHSEWAYETFSGLAAAYALNGETGRAADALAEARKSDEYPASVAQYCRQTPYCTNPTIRALVEPTFFKGLYLAGLPQE